MYEYKLISYATCRGPLAVAVKMNDMAREGWRYVETMEFGGDKELVFERFSPESSVVVESITPAEMG